MPPKVDKALRSKGPVTEETPSPGATTSNTTNTWDHGTSPTQSPGGDESQSRNPNSDSVSQIGIAGNNLNETVIQGQGQNRSAPRTLVNAELGRDSASQIAVLMAELEVRKAELELAQKAAATANCKLALARLEAQSTSGGAEQTDNTRVNNWVVQQQGQATQSVFVNQSREPQVESHAPLPIQEAPRSQPLVQLQRHMPDLPTFDGNITEWIAFRAEFEDSAPFFSDVNNVSRIRRALRGEARTAVKSIMYTVTRPSEIMEALERHFGDPEEIVITEIHSVKRMPRLNEDSSNIVSFAGQIANVVATIKALRQDKFLHAPELVGKIVDKLNVIVRYEWSKYRHANTGAPDLVAISTFLNEISCAAKRTHAKPHRGKVNTSTSYYNNDEKISRGARKNSSKHEPSRSRNRSYSSSSDSEYEHREVSYHVNRNPPKTHVEKRDKRSNPPTPAKTGTSPAPHKPRAPAPQILHETSRNRCVVCNGEHTVSLCPDFLKASVSNRWEMAKNSKLCYRCLNDSHRRPVKCKYAPCGIGQCEAGHHKLLHGLMAVDSTKRGNVGSVNHVSKSNTFLKIVPIEISGSLGTVETFALLDEGSTMTLIEREIADKLSPRENTEPLAIEGVGGHIVNDTESCKVRLSVRGLCSRNLEKMNAYTIERLNLATQEVSRELIEKCDHLRDIADELCYQQATPTVLIGQDNWNLIVTRQLLSGKSSLPVASLTKLGWVLHGRYLSQKKPVAFINHIRPATSDEEALTLIKQHFSIESLGVESKVQKSDPNQRAVEILQKTCRKIPNENRYESGLLWRSDDEKLPESKSLALRRLYSLERKLDRDADLKREYTAQIGNLIEKGFAEKVDSPPSPDNHRSFTLAHFPTWHPQKKKMRLVFDAAAKAYGKSLNDALLTGPDLLESLFGVMVRFREGVHAFCADIEAMFLHVEIIESDRDSLRFLWRGEDRSNPPAEFRMRRLIFGAASSPAIALYVKNANANAHKSEFPEAAEITIKNSYMDDMLVALDEDENKVKKIVNDLFELNNRASFVLRGFSSNNPNVISDVVSSDTDTSVICKSEIERTLGLKWNHKTDTLGFNVNLRNTPEKVLEGSTLPTKREVTSSAMSIFDPIGYVSPISVLGKALMQDIWRTGIGWDQIPSECKQAWLSYIQNIQQLRKLEIPRYVPATDRKGVLHTFCDASEKVYAAAVYFVSEDASGNKTSALVAAKARVAPLKTISIPRLELQSCVLGVRLADTVKKESGYEIGKRFFWSDSRTALSWIQSGPRAFKSFVAHRLAEIEETTMPTDWRWVPSALNVADDATKGVPAQFSTEHRWFHGPEFIRLEKSKWPVVKSDTPLELTGEERIQKIGIVNHVSNNVGYLPEVSRYSTFTKLIRVSAWVLVAAEVFKAKWLKRKPETEMKPSHMKLAEILNIKRSQESYFSEEIKLLKAGRPLPKKSSLHKVAVKLDRNGVIVLDARIDRDTAYIPVLHAKESLTKMLIHHYHALFNHGNHATVINEIKQRYYVIGLRGCIRYICNKCQWCRTHKGATLKAPVGDLPIERLQERQPPFTATAVDLFGPMTITIGRRHEKRWGVLFSCLTTRAVHLELAASLSSSSLILALRRMGARRGAPTVLYSDNGTNFIGSNRELQEAQKTLSETLQKFAPERKFIWKRIPPGNPAAGGAWERMVGCIKAALKLTLREKAPHEEVLHTLILEAEHIVNSRPLTPVNPDLDSEAITPNHFLILRSNGMVPYGSFSDEKLSLSSWKTSQALADTFWKRWIAEYRPTLMPRSSANQNSHILTEGDVVIITDHTLPRGTWPKGVIVQTYPGPDGHVRVADVKTNAGIVRRPACRMVVICSASDRR